MYYKNRSGYPVSAYLNRIHQQMENSFLSAQKISKDKKDAAELQVFFQRLKSAATGHKKADLSLSNEVMENILYNIQINTKHAHNFQVRNLFQKREGKYHAFEKDLARVIEAIWQEVGAEGFEFDKNRVTLGQARGSTLNLSEELLSEKWIQGLLKELGVKTKRRIKESQLIDKKNEQLYMQDVEGKIDVQGYRINIRADANPELVKYYDLLKDATFSAKNYDSMVWDKDKQAFMQTVGGNLKVGKTMELRALAGSLIALGETDPKTIASAVYAGINKINKSSDSEIASHFFHLRFMYELTGAGFSYRNFDNNSSIARFIIYNDPSGNIFVRSTLDILQQELKDKTNVQISEWKKQISLSIKNLTE